MGNTDKEIAKIKLQLERSEMMLEKLSSAVRGPLYSIMELARIARSEKFPTAQTNDYLRTIENSGRSINESINDIMALRQIYTNDVQLHPQRIYVIDLLNRLKADLERSLDSHNVTFAASDKSIMDIAVMADYSVLLNTARKLTKSLVNLTVFKNCIKFMIDKVSETTDILTLRFSIKFEGYSFTTSQINGLTAPFEALKSELESGNETTDTRFLIIRYFLHALGSDTIAIDRNDAGSIVISMDLPFTIIDKNDVSKIDIESLDFTGRRILVADDDNINLKVIERLLRDKNAEFITVRDGREALHTFRTEHGRFDIVLMDIIMPDMSGLDVARSIRSTTTLPNAKSVPIIAMTVNALHEHYYETKEAGMNAHLVKPIEPERLYATIAQLLK